MALVRESALEWSGSSRPSRKLWNFCWMCLNKSFIGASLLFNIIIYNFKKIYKILRIIKWRQPKGEYNGIIYIWNRRTPTHTLREWKGWTKEINRVSFNGAPAKFDIRAWNPDHTKMGKGITLSNEEFQVMVDAFKNQ